jgi:ABC-type proline/glycine betaine transport system substrate-binding protein/ABC-type branched-subunit amino acid transport system substrate-binding protein
MAVNQFPDKAVRHAATLSRRKLFNTLLLAVTALWCFWPPSISAAATPTLRIAVNPWVSSALNAQVAGILLHEQLGYQVDLVAIDEYAQFASLSKGDLDATLEIWPSGHVADHELYIEQLKTVEDIGPLGVVGQIGWFIPSYLLQQEPSLNTWQGIKAHTDLFKTSGSATSGQLLEGDPTWYYRDQAIISSLGLNLTITQTGSETALLSAIDGAFQHQSPLLFYFWTPHSLFAKYQLTQVQLPPDAPGCTDCGYPAEVLYKAVFAGLSQKAPAAYRLLKNLDLSNADQIEMLADAQNAGSTPETAARAWLAQNQPKWSAWLGDSSGAFPPIPAAANSWATNYLFVLDKDTNSVFVNANVLYAASLTSAFLQIKTVSDLRGHDDFYFYPSNVAAQFRADDRQVMDGGVPLSRVEVNEPVGGTRTLVHVTKVPLRNETNQVIGVRAIWHSHPVLEARRNTGGVTISLPGDASLFQLETDNAGVGATGWSPTGLPLNPADGRLTASLPATNAQAFFRASLNRSVQLGALVSLTGGWISLGKNMKAGIELGLEQVNLEELSSGSGLHFTADIRDTKLDPPTALAALQSLASNGVRVVIGPQSSSEVALLKPFADANGILLISPGSTASSLSIPDDNVLRFCPDDTYEAAAMVALLRADGIEAVVPVWRDDAGNQGLHDSLVRLFTASNRVVYAGVKYAAVETQFGPTVSALSAQVATALQAHPGKTAVYLAGFDEVAALFDVARTNATLQSLNWYGSDGVVQSQPLASDLTAAGFAAARFYPCPTFGLDDEFASTWKPLSAAISFRSGNDVDAFALAAYDAFRVAVLAYRQVKANSSFAEVKSAYLQAAASYIGATGATVLNQAGDRAGGAFDFWSLKPEGGGYTWYRSVSFTPDSAGGGRITRY